MTNRFLFLAFLNIGMFFFFSNESFAQQSKKTVKGKEKSTFFQNTWYGAGANLRFDGSQNESIFSIGLSPMAGYKITDDFSFGPRFSFALTSYRIGNGSNILKTTLFELSEAVFARYRFFNVIFLHGEYGFKHYQIPIYNSFNNKFDKSWINSQNAYAGLGYNSGGAFATEIYILYNFLADENVVSHPIELRAGITYNF